MASSHHRGEMDSAEWAVVIGGFSLFAIGLLAVLLIVVVNRRPAATVIAAAPIQKPTSTTPVAPAPPTAAAQSAYAPPPPAATAPPAQGNSTEESAGGLPDDEADESPDEDEQPTTITLQAPWPNEPEDRPGDTGVVSGESMGARLAREAQERAQAAREAREADRRAREEERRRRAEETSQAGGESYSPPPPPPSHIPRPPIHSSRPPQWEPHRVTGPEATYSANQEEEYTVAPDNTRQESRRPFRRSRFAAAVGLLLTGLHLLYSSLFNPRGLKEGRVTGPLVGALGSSAARLVCLFGGVFAVAFGAFVFYLNLQMLGVL